MLYYGRWPVSPAHSGGLLDTSILILRRRISSDALPDEMAICAVTLAELSAGVQLVMGDDVEARQERGRRTLLLQTVENEFDPLPFDAAAARQFGLISGAVRQTGRSPRRRLARLMIAAVAAAQSLPLFTTDPDDFLGLGGIVQVVPVPRPLSS